MFFSIHANSKGGVYMAKRKDFHPVLVPALDALIGDPGLITPTKDGKLKANDLYIPAQYIDRIHEFRDEDKQSSRGEAATTLLGSFSHMLEVIHYNDSDDAFTCANGMRIHFMPDDKLKLISTNRRSGSTTHALATARLAQENYGKDDVAILTGDDYMTSKALMSDIDVAHINPDIYTGRRKLVLPEKYYDEWFTNRHLSNESFAEAFPDEKPLLVNEFVEFEVDTSLAFTYGYSAGNITQLIGRFEYDSCRGEAELRRLHYVEDLPRYIQPRSAGQAMLAEVLMAPADEIPIVICPAVFGTGKTYMTTSTGLSMVADKKPKYDRIFVVPRDAELGKEIGFLPGNEREKTIAKAMPIVDNVRAFVKNKGDHKKGNAEMTADDISKRVEFLIQQYFEFTSIINMGGRSLSDCWIIYDEAQDMERFQINQLMKRIGDGSKMIITGDPNQVFNKHMSYYSNGLMYAATKMAGSRYAAVVSMFEDEITRSEAAREIARLLDH